jgi:signal transduction protein with GAF and PtsI domain
VRASTPSNPYRRPICGGLGARLRSIGQQVTKQGTLETTLEHLLGDLAGEIGARFASCWLDKPEAQQLEPLALWSVAGTAACPLAQASRHVRFAPGRGLPGTVLAADKPLRITDLAGDPSFLRSAAAGRAACSSAVAFPLRSDNQPIGVLEFLGTNVVPVTSGLDEAFGHVGALIGEFICARQAEQRVSDLSDILAGTTRAVGRLHCAHPDAVPAEICAAVREIAGAHAVLLWQPSPDSQALTVTAASGTHAEGLRASLTGERSGAAGAYHARKPIFIADVAAHVLPSKRLAAIAQAASALYQPICHRDDTLGVLAIAWKERRTQLPSEIQSAIELLALSAAPLLHNLRASHSIGQYNARNPRHAA